MEFRLKSDYRPMGDQPTGYVMFAPEGRVWFVLTGEGREPGESAQEKARLLETVIAYTGRYRIEGLGRQPGRLLFTGSHHQHT